MFEKISSSSPDHHARKQHLEFFKVFLPEFASIDLVIPPAFIDILDKPLPNEVLLVDEIKRSWCVETEVEDTEERFRVMFKKGWRKFVNDQSLEFGDFLVFCFDGDTRFSVTIFAKDGCRKYLGGDIDIVTATDKSRVLFDNEPITKPVEKEPVSEEMDVEPILEKEVDVEPDDEERLVAKRKRNRASVVKKELISVSGEDEPDDQYCWDSKTKPENRENTRRKVNRADDSCDDVVWVSSSSDKKHTRAENAMYKPENPHFVRTITHAALHRLEIPRTLLKSNGIDLEDDIELCDENGKKWPMKLAMFDKSIRFAKASWLPFVKGRNLRKNNKCLFEFVVKSNGSCNEIQVRVYCGRLRTIGTKSGYEVLAM